jgi:glycosyltransferase involved in cell wall biosynthesis
MSRDGGDVAVNDDVSVIVTCFNDGELLVEAVRSALAQSGGAPRIIVVDDGSTDAATRAAIDGLPPEVSVVRQPNAGVASARNTGLALAATPYVLTLDADDQLAPGALRALRLVLEREPTLGFSYGLMRFFGEWDGVLRMPAYDPYRLLYRHNIGSTALMRRELVEDVGGFDSTFRGYEDWEFWLHALAKGWRGRRVDEVTLHYRRHGSTRHLAARAEYRAAFRQIRRKHRDIYCRSGRRRLAAESDLGGAGRLLYRWWWGLRPVPARVELALQSLRWRPRSSRP